MHKAIKIVLVIVIIAIAALLFLHSSPPNPIAVIEVVDTAGKPVEGAIIKPDGLRPKKNHGHYLWPEDGPVKPAAVKTDKHGIARVPYPRYVVEKQETGEISFAIFHPEFCPDRPFRKVSITPPANAKLKEKLDFLYQFLTRRIVVRPEPVVLKRGGIVKVTGLMDGKDLVSAHLHPQLASMEIAGNGYWQTNDSGAFINRRIPEGSDSVRLVYLPPGGKAYFSDVTNFSSISGQTNEFQLELKPGFRLNGRLDDSVPRPVVSGRVVVSVLSPPMDTDGEKVSWSAWTKIKPDGAFTFDSLPAGHLEVAAICDGFKSKDGPGKVGNFIMPQVFEITNLDINAVIAMEPTANFEVKVVDDAGHPLSGATVNFCPNILSPDRGSSIFMGFTFNSAEVLNSPDDFDWRKVSEEWGPVYMACTDQSGKAVVSNLPAFKQGFAVTHTNFEMPIDPLSNMRSGSAQLYPGETTRATVKLQKTGTEYLQAP